MTLTDCAPKYNTYPDKGCSLFPSCLTCPLDKCALDDGISGFNRKERNEEITKRFKQGESIKDLKKSFGLSAITIRRAVRGSRNKVYNKEGG